jgi:cbb3-type cytochrome oxidase subunit 3
MIEFISNNAPIIGLIFFLSVFCIIVIILLLPKNKKKFKKYSKIPLKDDER